MHTTVASALLVAGLFIAPRLGHADPITLEEALRRAESRPLVTIANAERDVARGNARQATLPLYNPTLEAAAGPRWSSGSTFIGAQIGLAQTIELGGKRAARGGAADARLQAATLGARDAVRIARIEAWRAYELALVASLRREAAADAELAAAEVVAATQQAQALGGETQLRINLAIADLGRARHDHADAENVYSAALAGLASAIGAPPDEQPVPASAKFLLPAAVDTADEAVAQALAARSDLAQSKQQAVASSQDVRAADAAAVPDVTVSVTYTYDPDVDTRTQSVLLGASLPLPFRNRNEGEREASRAQLRRMEAETAWLTTEVRRAARLAFDRYVRAKATVAAFDRDVSERLRENLQLASDSFRAGKLDFYAFTTVRRELVANRLAYLDALAEAVEAWAELARASAMEVRR